MHSSETIKVVPARYPLRVVGALVALLVLAVVIQSVAFNPRWEWGVFARWFFDPVILEGLGQTLLLTLLGTVLSVIFGGLLALARLSSSWLLSSLAWGYIWLFRSLPLIVVFSAFYHRRRRRKSKRLASDCARFCFALYCRHLQKSRVEP